MKLTTLIRNAFQFALYRSRIRRLERQHAAGYARHPVQPDEVAGWEKIQAWGDMPDGFHQADCSQLSTTQSSLEQEPTNGIRPHPRH